MDAEQVVQGPGARQAARARALSGVERVGLLGLGCNLGDRRAQLQAAVHALPQIGVTVLACSSTYDTDPVGHVRNQPTFLNACVQVRTALAPLEALDAVKRLERELGRAAHSVRHGPRTIDIDILLLGELEIRHQRMLLPHEQLLTRRFVLIPALELDFQLCTPGGVRLSDALAALPMDASISDDDASPEGEGVRWAGPPLSAPHS